MVCCGDLDHITDDETTLNTIPNFSGDYHPAPSPFIFILWTSLARVVLHLCHSTALVRPRGTCTATRIRSKQDKKLEKFL